MQKTTDRRPSTANETARRELIQPSPAQAKAFEEARYAASGASVIVIKSEAGMGKTLILRHLHGALGGTFIDCAEMLDAIAADDIGKLTISLRGLFLEALEANDALFIDHLDVIEAPRLNGGYHPPLLLNALLTELHAKARSSNKTIVFTAIGELASAAVQGQAVAVEIPGFGPADYRAVAQRYLGDAAAQINFENVFRNSAKLSAHQLRSAMLILKNSGEAVSTETLNQAIARCLRDSNLDVSEVEDISFADLKGAEEIVERLERTILLPLREPELAKELGLKPKRGVLLHGEPGTGKTSIGRALARQMAGKFFMIDGSFVVGTSPFYGRVNRIFAAAIANSPSIIFIDDADVLFKSDNGGFNRYLLTKLDGLASESVGAVCVMMTAMNIADMPVAMLRSGRVEVWLETRLPDTQTRMEIVRHYAAGLPSQHQAFDEAELAKLTDRFTPADLRRLVGDARGHLAYDRMKGRPEKPFDAYLAACAREIADLKTKVAGATVGRSR